MQLRSFVQNHFIYLLFFFSAISVLVINKMLEHEDMIENKWAPHGIIHLELSYSQARQDSILQALDSTRKSISYFGSETQKQQKWLTGTKAANEQNDWDFIFICCYMLWLAVVFIKLYPPDGSQAGLIFGLSWIGIAGIFDCIENIFIGVALGDHLQHSNRFLPAWHIWLPATIKSLILTVAGIYLVMQFIRRGYLLRVLEKISHYLTTTTIVVIKYRIVVLGLLLVFFALWGMDQGRDLLLIVNNDNHTGPILLLSTITILALLNWYLPKIYVSMQNSRVSFPDFILGRWSGSANRAESTEDELDSARLMGTLTFLIPGVAILHAMRIFHIYYWLEGINPLIILIIVLAFYQFILKRGWIQKWFYPNQQVNMNRLQLIITVIIIIVIAPAFFHQHTKPYFLAWLSLNLFLLSFAFLLYVTVRTHLPPGSKFARTSMTPFAVIPGVILLIIFLIANIWPRIFFLGEQLRILTLPVVLCAVCFYTILFSYLLLKGRELQVRFISLLILACLFIAALKKNPYHEVRLGISKARPAVKPSLDAYIRSWLNHRRNEIDSFNRATGLDYPVFLVNSYGGGIRAAAWSAMLMSALDSQAVSYGGRPFQHYVFAYSGASGGTIGSSLLCAARAHDTLITPSGWKSFFENDFLTPVIIGMTGRDVWNSAFGADFCNDRAVLQEKIWEKHLADMHVSYDSPFHKYWDTTWAPAFDVPLLFANSYDADAGLKAIAAPVKLDTSDFPGSVFVENLIVDSFKYLRLSTAAFLSARFPYISPSGKMNDYTHLMDGGLKENSGAETSLEILKVFKQTLSEFTAADPLMSIRVYTLSLPNTVKGTDSLLKTSNLFELTSTFTALMNNWVGNSIKADSILSLDANLFDYSYFQVRPLGVTVDGIRPVLPLGWQISDYALRQISQSIDSQKVKLTSLVKIVRPK